MDKTELPAALQVLLAALFFLGVALLYFIFLPVSYSFDGTVFSHMLRGALLKNDFLGIVQVHHLLYFPLGFLSYRLLEALFSYQVLEFFHLQMVSMFFAVATLLLLERLLKKLDLELLPRLASVAMVAFSYAFWLFAVDAEVHVPGLFFTTAGMVLLLLRPAKFVPLSGAALCFVLAAGFHLTNGLIVVTVFLYLLAKRAPWRSFAQFYSVYFAALALLYGAFAALAGKPFLTLLYNVFFGANAYTGYRSTSFHAPALRTVAASFATLKNALTADGGAWAWAVLAGCLALLALGLLPNAAGKGTDFRRAMLFWFLPFFVFFTFWDTANIEFKINALLPLLMIAAGGMARSRPAVAATIGLSLAAGLLGVNLVFGIRPQADLNNNANYQVAAAIRKATPENAQVMICGNFLGYGHGKIYIPYFARRDVIILDWILGKGRSLPEIRMQLERISRSGRPLYALAEIAEPGTALQRLLDFHHVGADEFLRFRSGMRFLAVAGLPNGQRLYRMEFPALRP